MTVNLHCHCPNVIMTLSECKYELVTIDFDYFHCRTVFALHKQRDTVTVTVFSYFVHPNREIDQIEVQLFRTMIYIGILD